MSPLAQHNLHSLQSELSALGHKPSHAPQILRHFYQSHGLPTWSSLPLSASLRHQLNSTPPRTSRLLTKTVAADGTTKLLIGFPPQSPLLESPGIAIPGSLSPTPPNASVESVLMPSHRPGIAAGCLSSQIGCAMGCDFCASTRNGLERDLTTSEIVEQFLHLKEHAAQLNRRLKTIVFMGMGEPLLNFDSVVHAIKLIASPDLGALGWRQITVSTVGIVPAIDRLAALNLNLHLALSLHAPDDATRSRLVPANRRYPVAEIMSAARRFLAQTRRIPTIEYCMLSGINDSDAQAHLLAALMKDFRAHVNLIPYNTIGPALSGVTYQRPPPERLTTFLNILRAANVVTHFRHPRGDDVNAACGQLRQSRELSHR